MEIALARENEDKVPIDSITNGVHMSTLEFGARRMVKEYTESYYRHALKETAGNPTGRRDCLPVVSAS